MIIREGPGNKYRMADGIVDRIGTESWTKSWTGRFDRWFKHDGRVVAHPLL